MDTDKIRNSIAKLSGHTAAAKLRQVMPEIDAKVQDGVRHEEIVAALKSAGIDVNLETFRKNLYRYRAKIRKAGGPSAPVRPATMTDGNLSAGPQSVDAIPEPVGDTEFEAALDPKKRDAIGERYLNKRPALLGKNRSEKK